MFKTTFIAALALIETQAIQIRSEAGPRLDGINTTNAV